MSETTLDYLDVLSQPSTEPELAAQASKKAKRKMSKKARAAAMRNLEKARKAQKRRVKSVRATARAASAHKKKGGRGPSGPMKRTAKQRAAAKRNIEKAQAALRAKRAGKAKTHRLTARRPARSTSATTEAKTMKKGKRSKGKHKATRKQIAAARKNIKKAQAARRAKGKRSSGKKKTLAKRSAHRTAVAPPKPRKAVRHGGHKGKGKRRFTEKARIAAMANLRKARAARARAKKAGRKHDVRAYSYHSKPKRVTVPAHRSYEKHHKQSKKARAASLRNLKKARAALRHGHHGAHEGYMEAMVNALSGVEVVIGFGSMVVWFMVTDFVDRLLATHALTDKGTKDAAGHELYADNPPTTGDYAGLFNATAICAPMNVWRWVVGLVGMTGVPLAISFAVSNDVGRASLQAASFGAGIRIVGKALIDLVAYVTMWTPMGQQLYDGEMRAQVYASGDTTPLASLPSTGLGKAEKAGTGAPANDAGKESGTGWPSMPRETANAQSTGGEGGAPPPPAPPTTTSSQPGPSQPGYLAGLPPKRPNPYLWGHREEQEAAA